MSHVINNAVVVNPAQPFDPHRMPEAVKVPAPVNTRTFIFHADPAKDKTGHGIVIEGKGADDAEKIADLKRQLAEKQKLGWSTERQQHGKHPHSNDTARVERQALEAEKGDSYAKEALAAKEKASAVKVSPEDLKAENDLLHERIARLEAEMKAAAATKGHGKGHGKDD